jgi:hypothetical protein
VGPRAFLDAVVKRKIPSPCRESNRSRPARSPLTILTELSRLLQNFRTIYKLLTLCTCIREVPGSNLRRVAEYPKRNVS